MVLDAAENERKKPRIIRGLTDKTVDEGQSLELECEFEGENVEATWFLNGIMLRSNMFNTINFKPNQSTQLIMKEMFNEDAGLFRVRLRNQYGEVSTNCNVTVRRPETQKDQTRSNIEDLPPRYNRSCSCSMIRSIFILQFRFIQPISDVYIYQGQEAHFRAIISGNPTPKVTWFCNYKKITVSCRLIFDNCSTILMNFIIFKNNDKYRVTQDQDVYVLAVLRVDENDECEYSCKAENSAGDKACSANLHLIESPTASKSRT